jgi:hypothetical protein
LTVLSGLRSIADFLGGLLALAGGFPFGGVEGAVVLLPVFAMFLLYDEWTIKLFKK